MLWLEKWFSWNLTGPRGSWGDSPRGKREGHCKGNSIMKALRYLLKVFGISRHGRSNPSPPDPPLTATNFRQIATLRWIVPSIEGKPTKHIWSNLSEEMSRINIKIWGYSSLEAKKSRFHFRSPSRNEERRSSFKRRRGTILTQITDRKLIFTLLVNEIFYLWEDRILEHLKCGGWWLNFS